MSDVGGSCISLSCSCVQPSDRRLGDGDALRTELVLAALQMAIGQRKPRNVIHHNAIDPADIARYLCGRCREAGVRPSMDLVG